MKKIIEYKDGVTNYAIGDVVYLSRKNGKPTCRAIAINNDNGDWRFNPLQEQDSYMTMGGFIPFFGKPFIFAKEIEIKEEQL